MKTNLMVLTCLAGLMMLTPMRALGAITQQAYVKASNAEADDRFGKAVAISGDTMVVGAWFEDSNATGVGGNQSDNSNNNPGAAYVYVRTGSTWTQQAYLKASNAGGLFGAAVAISGDTIVIGAPNEASNAKGVNGNQADTSALGSGAVYVFGRVGTTWVQQAYLKASNTEYGDAFGTAVAISGDTIVVGAYAEDSNATGVDAPLLGGSGSQADNSAYASGAAYVFFRLAGQWSQQAYLKASNTGPDDHFGNSVAVSGDFVVIGADGESSDATGVDGDQSNNNKGRSGAAYVFVRNVAVWTQRSYLKASNTDTDDNFGISVAMSGDTIVVGAQNESSNATGINGDESDDSAIMAGAAYVFERTSPGWTQQAYLKASNTGDGDFFGAAVAVSGDTVVIGALGENGSSSGVNGPQVDETALDAGAAYVFVRSGSLWTQQAYVKASNPGSFDEFGAAVAVAGDTAVVGAHREDSNAMSVNGNESSNSAANAGAAYVFAGLGPIAPEIAIEQPTGTNLIDGSGSVAFGNVNLGTYKTLTFTIRNKGKASLTGLAIAKDGANSAEFITTGPVNTTLAVNTSTTFTVKFTPIGAGQRDAAIHIASNDGDESPFDVPLTGFGFAKPTIIAPAIAPLLLGVGEFAAFNVTATGSGTLTYVWLKNGAAIPGAASIPTYFIHSAALTDAGIYSVIVKNAAGAATSPGVRLGVVGSASIPFVVNEAGTLALTVPKAIPAGPAPTHQWKKGAANLSNGGVSPAQVTSGATAATLSITKMNTPNDGSYTCVVGMDGLTKESGSFTVVTRLKPVINAAGPFAWFVSGAVTDQITAANSPTSFSITGLPASVTYNKTNGQLSGKPNAATTSTPFFTVTASNLAGTSAPVKINYTVAALPAPSIGRFDGLVDRSTALSGPVAGQFLKGHGGSLYNLVITSTGSFTATLKVEDKTYAMPAASRLEANAGGNPSASVKILRGTATDTIPDLTFAFSINKLTGELTGTLTDGLIGSPVNVKAWHNPWIVSTNPLIHNPATAAKYNAALELDPALAGTDPGTVPPGNATNLIYPQGTGYGTLTTTTAGMASWAGKAADGTVLTLSTTMGPGGEVPLWFLLYTPTVAATAGSMQGWVKITGNDLDSVAPFDWMKLAQLPTSTTRSYKSGFPLHNLTVVGGKYVPPTNVTSALSLSAPPNNARIIFNEGGIKDSTLGVAGSLAQIFSISATNAITMPAGLSNNPGIVTLAAFSATTGAISGNFTLTDNDPRDLVSPFVTVTRSTPWSGVLVPRLGKGVGQFQLANLPTNVAPATTPSTSPQLSGNVVLKANP